MKHLILLLFLPMVMIAQADEKTVKSSEWLTDYDKAIATADTTNKNILIYFTGSDWCPPCKSLKTDLFDSAEFAALSDKYVLLYIDIPMNRGLLSAEQLAHNKELSSKLNKKDSVPLLKILSEDGKELGKYAGYSMNGDTRYHLELLKKHK